MPGRIFRELRPVRRRQQIAAILGSTAWGLLASALIGVGLGVWHLLTRLSVPLALAAPVMLAGPGLGLLVALARRGGWQTAATAVDVHYQLKDRTATALDFLNRTKAEPIHELQIQDALEHLSRVEPRAVVPFRIPRPLPVAAGLSALAVILMGWSLSPPAEAEPITANEAVVAEAEQIAENLRDLDELAKSERDPELKALVEQLRQKVEEMKQPGVDVREALAKLSEMQTAIQHQQAQYNLGLVDGQLQSLGAAMTPADALEAAGQALQEGKFDQAAQELEALDHPELDRKEARAVKEALKQVAESAGDAGLGPLSDAASELAEGVKGGNGARIKKASRSLAKLTRAHARRRKIDRLLKNEVINLAECKSRCEANSLFKAKLTRKSISPSSVFGLTVSGNTLGEKTSLASSRNLQELSGDPGDGPSEMETTHSPEGRQRASRSYRDAYQKALKKSEAVLESEPIPLGHRQTIRRYFESIRPQNDDGSLTGPG
ncbi:MAG: hypothetical protein ABI353_06365 [Isosphaeraceae bacterium]